MLIIQLVDLADGLFAFEEAEADQIVGLKSAIDVKVVDDKIYMLREKLEHAGDFYGKDPMEMRRVQEDQRRQKLKEIKEEYGEETAKEKEQTIEVPLMRDFEDSKITKCQVVEVLELRS